MKWRLSNKEGECTRETLRGRESRGEERNLSSISYIFFSPPLLYSADGVQRWKSDRRDIRKPRKPDRRKRSRRTARTSAKIRTTRPPQPRPCHLLLS